MPTYGYECIGCSRNFEVFQKITDDSLTQCEVCGGVLKKKIFPVGIVFKGSGFYVNDYAKKSGASDDAAATVKTEVAKADPATVAPSATAETTAVAQGPSESKPAESKPAESTPATTAPSTPST